MFLLLVLLFLFIAPLHPEKSVETIPPVQILQTPSERLYAEMKLDSIISFKAFEQAVTGYENINVKNRDILTLIDFSLPSTQKRLYVLDMKNHQLLFTSYVAHGKKSGDNYATSFSNRIGSLQSSLGFYETENTYQGGNGYSLVLNGLEKGINDRAKARAIVMHGANYCNPALIKSMGRLGRSFGCPALPVELTRPIINTIKGGTLLYIYADNSEYVKNSPILTACRAPNPLDHLLAIGRYHVSNTVHNPL